MLKATGYSLFEAQEPINRQAYLSMKAGSTFQNIATAPNRLWRTDFTNLRAYWLSPALSLRCGN